jgi:MYXO-CTERM domain-containing protein
MRALFAALIALCASSAYAQPEDPGPFTAVSEVDTIQTGPSTDSATVCIPDAPGARPVMVIAPGSLEGRTVLEGLCLHLATYGFVVAIPDLGFANTDMGSIGQTLEDTLQFFAREGARTGSRFNGRIDFAHRGVIGYNTGGMGALQAAIDDPGISVAILLDPDDINGQARAAAPKAKSVPVMLLNADASACNGQSSFDSVYDVLGAPRSTAHIAYSSGCDAEWTTTNQCQAVCGLARAYATDRYRRFTTAYANYFVGCDPQSRTYVDGTQYRNEIDDLTLDHTAQADLPSACGPYVKPDAGPPDAGPVVDQSAIGCNCSHAGSWEGLAAILALAALRRRR